MSDELDFDGDVCQRCRHVLRDNVCPSCGWQPARVEGALPPHEPDDLPSIRGA